jgi:DNA polymerase-1
VVHLIDASVYVFRAWFSLPDSMRAPGGQPVNAVYGYTRFLVDLLRDARPKRIAAAFDQSLESSFRNDAYPDYKANREPAPDDLKAQFELCRRMTRALGVLDLASDRYEADDLIGTLAMQARRARLPFTIVSRDKDLTQLLGPKDVLWDFAGDERHDRAAVFAKFGVWPEQIADYLGLMGDAVDNIPGVRGVGPKAASALLSAFDDLEGVYKNLSKVPNLPVRGAARLAELLAAQKQEAFLSRKLATVHCKVPMKHTLKHLDWKGVDAVAVDALCAELGFGRTLGSAIGKLPQRR